LYTVTPLIKFRQGQLVPVTNIFYLTQSFFCVCRQNKGEKVEKPRTTGDDAEKSDDLLNPEVMSYAEIQVRNIISRRFVKMYRLQYYTG
jgi:hypothetical protein